MATAFSSSYSSNTTISGSDFSLYVGRINSSNHEGIGFEVSTVQVMCFPLIIAVGLIGNTLICVAVCRRSRLRVTDSFIVNLAATDLATCLISIPFDFVEVLAGNWPFGSYLCKTVYPLQTILISVSVYTLLCISLERRRAIMKPFMPKVKRWWVVSGVCLLWVISSLLVGPYIAILDVKYSNGSRECIENWPERVHAKAFTLSVFFVLFLLPLFAITANYLAISSKLWKDIQRIKTVIGNLPNRQGKKRLIEARAQRNMRIVKMFVVAVVAFAVCMVPNHVVWIWHDFGSGSTSIYFSTILGFCHILMYANSAINPFIFIALHSRYRKEIMSIFACLSCSTQLSCCHGNQAREQFKKHRRKQRFSQARRRALRERNHDTDKLTYLRESPWNKQRESASSCIRDYNGSKQQPAMRQGLLGDNAGQAECMLRPRKSTVNFGGEKTFHIEKFDDKEMESVI